MGLNISGSPELPQHQRLQRDARPLLIFIMLRANGSASASPAPVRLPRPLGAVEPLLHSRG
eukprot:346712-Prorocentrum_minimum.AAC.1